MRLSRSRGAVFAATILSASIFVLAVAQAGAFGGSKTVHEPSLTEEQVLSDLPHIAEARAQGTPVYIAPAPTPDPGAVPELHGSFRIVPAGFVGELTTARLQRPENTGIATNDIATITESPLWAAPSHLPAGFNLSRADTFDNVQTSNIALRAVYSDSNGGEIIVNRRRVAQLPVDLHFDYQSPTLSLELITFSDGDTGIVLSPKSLEQQRTSGLPEEVLMAPEQAWKYVARFDEDSNVLTAIETFGATGISVNDLIAMLESVNQ